MLFYCSLANNKEKNQKKNEEERLVFYFKYMNKYDD